jgi:Cys-tRNA(Pro)/Cys-tRNA(Cys) deacylase
MIQNNVTRMLQAKAVKFEAYELPAEKLGAAEAAAYLGVPAPQVYKTIVVLRPERGKPLLAVVPGDQSVNLKKVAKCIGAKKVSLPTEKQAEQLTGLQAGGISPLALVNRGFDVLLDLSAQEVPLIFVSGGQRGLNIRLAPADLVKITRARYVDLV